MIARLSVGCLCALALCSCSKPYADEKVSESIALASSFSKQLDSSLESTRDTDTPSTFAQSLLTLIDDESLRALLDMALANNTNILTLTSQIAQAREALGLASANMLPKLSINMGYNYSSGNYNRYQININQNTLNANLSLSWELDLFGKLNMLRKSKKYDYLATLSNLSVAQVSLIGEVASNYYAYKRITNAARLQEQMLNNYGRILDTLRHKHDLGLIDITILSDTIAALNAAKSAHSSLLLEQEKMKNALIVLLNTSDTQALTLLLNGSELESKAQRLESSLDSSLPSIKLPSINALPKDILLSRDDVRASIASLNAQVMLKNSKKAALFPSLSLGGNLGQILFSSRGVGDLIWSITGSLASPLINRSALTKDYKIQKESVKQAFYALESTLRTALGEIENAITEVNTAQSSLQAKEQVLSTSQEVWLAARTRYELGLLDESSYLTSYNALLSARQSVDEARFARLSSVIVLYKALGGKLAVEHQAKRTKERTLDSSNNLLKG
ncbi:TolC family protein [Helicobacter canis]|uniref:TolC family protein n=1 Tax=Helicobacter canis TaxID=29419 RepID=A0A5M9QPJ0_9HELI|nr:TolC family protein [Helicobacter canis]KAA8709612.1 TolC family protein [Helicobacter canis]